MHKIAKSYGVLPHTLLTLSPEDVGINRICWEAGNDDEHSRLERMKGVQPMMIVAGG